jgi:hypothetical protein
MTILQDVFVTLVALSAAIFVVRRVFVTLRPAGNESACASCEAERKRA